MAPARDGQWKLYDWERLDLGLSESAEIGIYCRYVESNRLDSYYTLSDHLQQADDLILEGDYLAAAEQVKLAENISVVAELSDFCHVLVGYRWQQLSEFPKARLSFEKVRHPEQMPGAFFGLMNCSEYDDPEFALRNATQYENCVGPGVDLCSRKARMLERLKRPEEAMIEWKKILRLEADHTGALSALLKEFSDENKSDLTQYLTRLDDPVQTAITLVDYIEHDDRSSRAFLMDFVRSREPDAARTEAMMGQVLHADGQLQEAAEHYEAALKKEHDEDERELYASSYLDLMTDLGRVLEAVDRVPDKNSAYEYLLVSYEEGDIALSNSEYQEITRRYYSEFPENGWAVYYRAEAMNKFDDSKGAVNLLQKYLQSSESSSDEDDEYIDTSVRSLLTTMQFSSGVEAATLLETDHSNFSTLTNAALADERWTVVKDLIAAREPVASDDVDLLRLQARLANHEQRWDDAIETCTRAEAITRTVPEHAHLSWEFNRLLRSASLNSGQWKRFYDSQTDKSDAFSTLASNLISLRNWTHFRLLVEHHQQIMPDDPQIPQMKSESEWFHKDYAPCVNSCVAALKQAESDIEQRLGDWQKSRLQARHRACLLHLERHTEAKKLAQLVLADEQDPIPLAIVAAAQGHAQDTRRLAEEAFEQTESLQEMYTDPQATGFILQEQFADLHERCPVRIPYLRANDRVVFLFEQPPSLDIPTLTQLIKEFAPGEQPIIEEYQSAHSGATSAVVVRLSDTIIQIVAVSGHSDDWKLKQPDQQVASFVSTEARGTLTAIRIRNSFADSDCDLRRIRKARLSPANGPGVSCLQLHQCWKTGCIPATCHLMVSRKYMRRMTTPISFNQLVSSSKLLDSWSCRIPLNRQWVWKFNARSVIPNWEKPFGSRYRMHVMCLTETLNSTVHCSRLPGCCQPCVSI
jgi:tetratricopeptide (TPR) repeat protein